MRRAHEDLAAAHDRQDWTFLWAESIPLVKKTVHMVLREWHLPGEFATEDLLQEGYLAARAVVERWDPMLSAFSTAVINGVRPAIRDLLRQALSGSIGSRRVRTEVYAFDDSVAHEGPAEFRDPLVQAEEAEYHALLTAAIEHMRDRPAQAAVRAVYGIGQRVEGVQEFADRTGVSRITAWRRLKQAEKYLKQSLSKVL